MTVGNNHHDDVQPKSRLRDVCLYFDLRTLSGEQFIASHDAIYIFLSILIELAF